MVSEWLKRNKLSVMIREDFNHDNVEDVVDVDTGEVIGKFYPDGYNKVHCFIDQRGIIGSSRMSVLRAVARNFFAINCYKGRDDAYALCKEYIALVSEEKGYSITQSEIDDAVSWGINNRVADYKELMSTSYFTFNARNLPYETIRKVVCRYMSRTKKMRSLLLMGSAIQLQKEAVSFITKPSTVKVSRNVDEDNVGVSLTTVKKHWNVFSEDVNAYHSSTFGTDNYAERRAASTMETLIESYNRGNKTKMALHKDTSISRPTIDNYWKIITK
jgi:hypothetical protein